MRSLFFRRGACCCLLLLVSGRAIADQDRYAAVVERILESWKSADAVCLGEDHGRKYDSDLRLALVRHPAFPRTVRVIVVEFANPVHQALLDRFILDGAEMSRQELAVVWRDATGAEVWETSIYEEFLRAVRQVNLGLLREQRVRVLGGDSPIDWSKITKAEQLVPLINRGGNIRTIIAREILDAHLKGLAIYGARHCDKTGGGFPGDLAGKYPAGRMWSIEPFVGETGAQEGKMLFGLGDQPAYIVINGTARATAPAADALAVKPKLTMGDVTDAVVYHGAVPDTVVHADLTELKARYGTELARRGRLMDQAFRLWLRR
jgi:hypothetical protein